MTIATHRKTSRVLTLLVVALFGSAVPTFAAGAFGDCSGDPGYVLTMPTTIEVGSSLVISFEAPQGGTLFLLVSNGPGPTDTPVGTFCLNFPPVYIFAIPLPDSGKLSLVRQLPCDPG